MRTFHSLSIRHSDSQILAHRPADVLRRGAELWKGLDDAARLVVQEDSEYFDFDKRANRRKPDPILARSYSLENEVFKAATQAGRGNLSAGVRCLIRLTVRKAPTTRAVQKESLTHWQTVTVGAELLNDLRAVSGRYYEDNIFLPLAVKVWSVLPPAKQHDLAAMVRQDDWLRRKSKDGTIAINGKLSKPDWDTIVNLGGGNRSRGARVVLRALLDVMREQKATKENPS